MNIVVIDAQYLSGTDLSWSWLEAHGSVEVYDHTLAVQTILRCKSATAVIVNKVVFDAAVIAQLPSLKYISVTATGVNNVDLDAAKKAGIVVTNAAGYSTDSVAQYVISCILHHFNFLDPHFQSVRQGEWVEKAEWTYRLKTIRELSELTIGILGFGNIAQATIVLAQAFGLTILVYQRDHERFVDSFPEISFVEKEELLRKSDIISVHLPLTSSTKGIIDHVDISQIQESSILINASRGTLINEAALCQALTENRLAAAYLDVLPSEPPASLDALQALPNAFISPHIAWSTLASRKRLMEVLKKNFTAYLSNTSTNRVV